MKKYFFAGLVTLLPLAVTFWVIHSIVSILTKPFQGIVVSFIGSLNGILWYIPVGIIQWISRVLILIILFLFTLFLGFVARRFFFYHLIKLGDSILYKIPLINKVYKTSK